MKLYELTATPTIQSGQVVAWELCYLDSPQSRCGDGSQARPYPEVVVPKNHSNQPFKFTILGENDIVFSPDSTPVKYYPGPFWIDKKGQPSKPGVHSQIEDVKGAGTKELHFNNKNKNKGELVLKYQLNFVDAQKNVVKSLDPDIRNGGKTVALFDSVAAVLIGAAVVAALVAGVVSALVAKSIASNAAGKRATSAGATKTQG